MPDQLADYLAIRRLIAEASRAFDTGDHRGWLAAFTDDAILESSSGLRAAGREELSEFYDRQGHDTLHVTADPVVVVEGDEATHTASYLVFRRVEGEPRPVAMGLYRDSLVRTSSGWKLSGRLSESR